GPTYDLVAIQALVAAGRVKLTAVAFATSGQLGFDTADVHDCIKELTPADFYKTMESLTRTGTFQDVYKPSYCGQDLYLKLQIGTDRGGADLVFVISCKRDESHD